MRSGRQTTAHATRLAGDGGGLAEVGGGVDGIVRRGLSGNRVLTAALYTLLFPIPQTGGIRAMRLPAAALCVLVCAAPAMASGLPAFDSAAYCAKVGFVGMTQTTTTLDGCAAQEATARADLEAAWSKIPIDVQAHCALAAEFTGTGSYALLASCLAKTAAERALNSGETLGN